MAQQLTPEEILNTPPEEDQGSEALCGFDYQAHCTARLSLWMMSDRKIVETVCEYHEDVTQLYLGRPPRFCQIKKRESARTWTIDLLGDAILKLFRKLRYKDVGELVIYGHGRPSQHGTPSLGGLMALLDRPETERDSVWADGLEPYEQYLFGLFDSELDMDTIGRGLRLLRIDLTMPHPHGIGSDNVMLTARTILRIWDVDVTLTLAEKAYLALYRRVWKASTQPKQPRTVKRILAQEARQILHEILLQEGLLARDPSMLLDTREKLAKGNLEQHLDYVLERRMDARQAKLELDLTSAEWQDLKDDIAVAWDDFQLRNVGVFGPRLWRELRSLLKALGEHWSTVRKNSAFGPSFSEALFFDMVAVCEASFGV